jgi:hypothetical protein
MFAMLVATLPRMAERVREYAKLYPKQPDEAKGHRSEFSLRFTGFKRFGAIQTPCSPTW